MDLVLILFTTNTWIMIEKQLLKKALLLKQQFTEHTKMNASSINVKNQTYYFFNDMINIKSSNWNLLKIDIKSHRNIDTYYIGYEAIKKIDDYENIYSINFLCLIVDTVDGHIEEKNGNKYWTFPSTNEKKVFIQIC